MQFLYGNDIHGAVDFSSEAIRSFWEIRQAHDPAREFAGLLLELVREHLPEVDSAIRATLENFAFERLSPVDRNILRVGASEVLFADHIPPEAAINEAIEIARRFGGEESPKFVNGILDRIHRERKNLLTDA